MGAKGKAEFKDNWLVRRRHAAPQSGDCGRRACLKAASTALGARVLAAKVIAAYVAKQRRVETEMAKANGAAGNKQAEVAAVWHDGDAKNPDKLQAGHFEVPAGTCRSR